jgi:hypothetical protein
MLRYWRALASLCLSSALSWGTPRRRRHSATLTLSTTRFARQPNASVRSSPEMEPRPSKPRPVNTDRQYRYPTPTRLTGARARNFGDDDGRLLWDASCLLVSTIMVPGNGDRELRAQYAAQLRLEKANALTDGKTLLRTRDHVLAGKFRARKRIDQIMQTRRIHSALAGAMLWDLHTAAAAHPKVATKSKIEFAIDRISIAQNRLGSLATIRDAWRQFRSVIHWCAALA